MNDSDPSFQHWIDRLGAGDPTARNELIRRSRDRLRLLTRQMLRRFPMVQQWEETSDVLQEVLFRLDRALQAVTVPTARDFFRLATAIIRRELIDLTRHFRGPHRNVVLRLAPGLDVHQAADPADTSGDPYQLAVWQEFHEVIAALNDADRELFELLYYQGLTQAEAVSMLGIPLSTLRRRWRKAKERLLRPFGGVLPLELLK